MSKEFRTFVVLCSIIYEGENEKKSLAFDYLTICFRLPKNAKLEIQILHTSIHQDLDYILFLFIL